jgi:hypothetical protein
LFRRARRRGTMYRAHRAHRARRGAQCIVPLRSLHCLCSQGQQVLIGRMIQGANPPSPSDHFLRQRLGLAPRPNGARAPLHPATSGHKP